MPKEQSSTVIKALRILECFIDDKTEWTLKRISEAVDMPTTSTYRQLSTLVNQRYLVQDSVRKSYHIGPKLLLLSGVIFGQYDLRQIAHPVMEHLCDTIKETINLSILIDHDIFYLDKVESSRSISCRTRIGDRVPAYATSSGKIMIANRSARDVDTYCQWMSTHAKALTPYTITDVEMFRQELAAARLNGYACDHGEIEKGLICFGAPIYDNYGTAIAAISVAGPDYRMESEQEVITKAICAAAKDISMLLGG